MASHHIFSRSDLIFEAHRFTLHTLSIASVDIEGIVIGRELQSSVRVRIMIPATAMRRALGSNTAQNVMAAGPRTTRTAQRSVGSAQAMWSVSPPATMMQYTTASASVDFLGSSNTFPTSFAPASVTVPRLPSALMETAITICCNLEEDDGG
jgi:hypothetical protein